jgi:hypothetical protein
MLPFKSTAVQEELYTALIAHADETGLVVNLNRIVANYTTIAWNKAHPAFKTLLQLRAFPRVEKANGRLHIWVR